ncbi:MAG: hypothetical protein LQ346_006285 [Caloplaca aetnensis]|nr:MAG: hypothetical protein LQ346_006285 [Caloplaca aetnensis]
MQRISTSKFNVLKKQQHGTYEKKKQATLPAIQSERDLSKQVPGLLDALVVHDIPAVVSNHSPKNIRRFLNQRRNDPSVPYSMLEVWKADLNRCLHIQSHKYQYASLFCRFFTQWLE